MRLILWDIDHTLIETRGVGAALYRAAFEEITGLPMRYQTDVTGKTEAVILAETLRLHDIEPTDTHQEHISRALAAQYARHTDQLRRQGRALPGAAEALAALEELSGVVQGVLTGNFKAVAIMKLDAFGLAPHIDFDISAYGDDNDDRAALVVLARQRATRKFRCQFTAENTVIVGDTSHDVAAARRGGAAIVAVATGRDTREDLQRAGAEIVLPDLTNTPQVIDAATRGGTSIDRAAID